MKTLVLDIENSYILMGGWGLWNQNFGIDQILDSGKVLCYAAKWLGEKEIVFSKHDDDLFLPLIHSLLDEADAIITFNGRKHDIPLLNREFIKAGLPPPSPYAHIDLFRTVKDTFKFPSNKLDWVLRELNLGQKKKHEGFPLWVKVLQDDPAAWSVMREYNIVDVRKTERLYLKLRPWISGHPNHALHDPASRCVCPNCGSTRVQWRGYFHTKTQSYKRFRCNGCGSWSRTRFTEIEKERRELILTGV